MVTHVWETHGRLGGVTDLEDLRCAEVWGRAGVSAAGTAPLASFWVAVEQPGSWGRKAFAQCGLDPALATTFEKSVAAAGGRAELIRRPGSHADSGGERVVLVAGGLATRPWLGRQVIALDQLPGLLVRLQELAPSLGCAIAPPENFEPLPAVLLLCTNGKRDRCCAIDARPVVHALAERLPGELVWESSHLGGHRFAPTGVVLPTGQLFAHLGVEEAQEALELASVGRLSNLGARKERGRSCFQRPAQAVDIEARTLLGEDDPTALRFDVAQVDAATWTVRVRHRDCREFLFDAHTVEQGARPESCGGPVVPAFTWVVQQRVALGA